MRAPLDYAIVAALGVGNFVLSFVGYWWPPDKVFDEIYFARAGEEYLQNLRIYENTHPPLSKLLITLSMMLFGGMPKGHGLGGWTGLNALIGHMANGDNSYGWRFLDVVFGALVVMLLYVFAKRITGSTVFATIAALLLTFDGMHFVQSRIATPEGFVVFFATLAVYAFYRFWISSQVGERAARRRSGVGICRGRRRRRWSPASPSRFARARRIGVRRRDDDGRRRSTSPAGSICIVRYVVFPRIFGDGRRELTFAEGSYALRGRMATRRVRCRRRRRSTPAERSSAARVSQSQGRRARLRRRSADDRVPARRERALRDARRATRSTPRMRFAIRRRRREGRARRSSG